jgi:hypothetical protein
MKFMNGGHHIFCNWAMRGPREECALCDRLFKSTPYDPERTDVDELGRELIETHYPEVKILE